MKTRTVVGVLLIVIAAWIFLSGCSKSASNAMTESGAAAAASPASSMAAGAANLYDQLGGAQGVVQLADAFGAHLSKNPLVTKYLDAASITQAKNGLVNEIAKASGMAAPNPGADLMGALSGKGLDAAAMGGVTASLASAADEVKMGSAQKTALMGMIEPMMKTLAGQ